jgi:hypothetical protein
MRSFGLLPAINRNERKKRRKEMKGDEQKSAEMEDEGKSGCNKEKFQSR